MIDYIKKLSSCLRNLFVSGEFQKRYDDGTIQVHTNRVVEKKEAFPYGFYAKAKSGRAFVFCRGGNPDNFEIFPIVPGDDISPPELEEGDAALYTQSGGFILLRETGTVELFGTDAGGVVKAAELKTQLDKLSARVDGIIDALNNAIPGAMDGGVALHTTIKTGLASIVDKEDFSDIESEKVLHGTGE
jgi:phage gp45-like